MKSGMEHVLDEIATPLDFLRFLSLAKMHAFAVTGPCTMRWLVRTTVIIAGNGTGRTPFCSPPTVDVASCHSESEPMSGAVLTGTTNVIARAVDQTHKPCLVNRSNPRCDDEAVASRGLSGRLGQ